MIDATNIHKSFGSKEVLKGCSFSLEIGESVGLVGLNGAGKTTLLRTLLGLLKADSGTVSFFDKNPYEESGSFYKEIGTVLENDGFNGNLTFSQNINFFAKIKQINPDKLICYLNSNWSHLLSREEPIKQFSRGQRVQCSLARAFLGEPKLLVLDEPTTALDLDGYTHFCTLVKEAKERGAIVIISSHRIETVESLCETVLFLEDGKIDKISLTNDSEKKYRANCSNTLVFQNLVENINGTVHSADSSLITFSNISKDSVATLVSQFCAAGEKLYELREESKLLGEDNRV
jgi:ABC-type multidrug transport system ATPase subunit